MIDLIETRRNQLDQLCRKYQVKTLEVFGSAATGAFDPSRSDLDFLVEFLPQAAQRVFHGYFDFRDELQKLFGRRVDLVMPGAIRTAHFREAVNQQRKRLYAA